MKRKSILVLIVLLVSAVFFYAAKTLQKNEISNNQLVPEKKIEAAKNIENELEKKNETSSKIIESEAKKETDATKEAEKPKTGNTESVQNNLEVQKQENNTTKNNTANKQTAKVSESNVINQENSQVPVEEPNLIITDDVSGKIILSKRVNFNGQTASQATTMTLEAANVSYKTATFGNSVYFSSINGIRERSAGASSGWCYYINGKKLGIGAGDYKLNQNDKLEWKFLKDGLSN